MIYLFGEARFAEGAMNQLNVSTQQSIIALLERGWSQRRIAWELRLDRSTVARYARLAAKPASNPTHGVAAKPATNLPHGSGSEVEPKPATNPTHGDPPGPTSLCAQFAETIGVAVQAGLSAQRIYQDLVCEHGFAGSYCSVKRFVRRITQRYALPFRRLECAAGEEMQIDFGGGAKTTARICSGRSSRTRARVTARWCGGRTPSR